MRRVGRSFIALVVIGGCLEMAGVFVFWRGLLTMAECYWAWFPFAPLLAFRPLVCTDPIVGVGLHVFVPLVMLGVLLVVSIASGLVTVARLLAGVRRLRRALGPVEAALPPELSRAAGIAGVPMVQLRRDGEPYAVCVGMLRPVVVVSSALLGLLSHDELVAVLAHEARHLRRRAPLRALVARSIAGTLFFLPVLADLVDAHLLDEELLADEEAVHAAGRRALVSALAAIWGRIALPAAGSAITGTMALDERLRALRHGTATPVRLARPRLLVSLLALLLFAGLVAWMPVAGGLL